jgi:uncharacterized membrane protein YphA (DoxX/SURF4 family)
MTAVTEHFIAWPPPSAESARVPAQVRTMALPLLPTKSVPVRSLRPKPATARANVRPPMAKTTTAGSSTSAMLILLPVRIFLAAGWIRAGVEKLIETNWWNGTELRTFLATNHEHALPFFRPVMDRAIDPAAIIVAFVVMATEIGCGVAIALGKPMRLALRWGVLLNVVFILCGVVNPSAFYLIMEIALLFAIAEGTIGVHPSLPTRRTFLHVGLAATAGIALAPYIRTMEPAEAIADPAMMLVFVSFVVVATLTLRWAIAEHRAGEPCASTRWTEVAVRWAHAQPRAEQRTDAHEAPSRFG